MCRVSNPYTSDLTANTSKDGVHYFGPVFGKPVIRNLSGIYGDDCAIFDNYSGGGYSAYVPPSCGGSFYQGGLIENINIVKAGNSGAAGLYPAHTPGGALIGTSAWRMYGRYDFKNISRGYPTGSGSPGSAVFIGNGYSTDAGEVDEIYIEGVVGSIGIDNTTASKLITIDKITINNSFSNKIGDYTTILLGYLIANVVNINVNNYFQGSVSNNAITLKASTTINKLSISGKIDSTSATSAFNVLKSTSASVNYVDFHDIVLIGGNSQLHDFSASSFTNSPMLTYRNIDSETSYAFCVGGGNWDYKIDNFRYGSANPFNFYGGSSTLSFSNVVSSTNQNPFVNTSCTIINATPAPMNVSRVSPTSGATVTIANKYGINKRLIAPAGTLATLTLALPTPPINGEILQLSFTQQITTLTVSNGTIQGLPTAGTVAAGFGGTWQYSLADTLWIRYT